MCSLHFFPNYPFVVAFRDLVISLVNHAVLFYASRAIFVYFALHVIVLRLYTQLLVLVLDIFKTVTFVVSLVNLLALFTCNLLASIMYLAI